MYTMIKKIIIPLLCAFLSFAGTCGEDEPSEYVLSITGYKGNFNGYYIADSEDTVYFEGEESYTDSLSNKYYDYEKDLPNFSSSILVQVYKQTEASTVTARLWKDDKVVESVSCIENETTTSGGTIYKLDLPELYYEVTGTSSDE